MLRDSPLDVVLLATDLDVARDSYSNKLGLALIDGSGQRLTFSCGDDSRVIISKSESGTADSQTQPSGVSRTSPRSRRSETAGEPAGTAIRSSPNQPLGGSVVEEAERHLSAVRTPLGFGAPSGFHGRRSTRGAGFHRRPYATPSAESRRAPCSHRDARGGRAAVVPALCGVRSKRDGLARAGASRTGNATGQAAQGRGLDQVRLPASSRRRNVHHPRRREHGGHERLALKATPDLHDAATAHCVAIIAEPERRWQERCDRSGGRRR
jgi:hypothetical protein